MNVGITTAVLSGPGLQVSARAACSDVDFAATATVRTAAPRSRLLSDFEADARCPGRLSDCRSTAYAVPGNAVLVTGSPVPGHVRAMFSSPQGRSTTGWLPESARSPIAFIARDRTGDWRGTETHLATYPAAGGSLRVDEVKGTAAPCDGTLAFTVGFEGTLPYGKGDPADCRIILTRRGPYLLAQDNMNCGGQNVTFSGLCRRRR